MSVSVRRDTAGRTMTITAEFAASVERVWRMWADPRQLERWWGPPAHPATVVEHDLTPGGEVSFFVTGPAGERRSGWWRVVAVGEPHRLEFDLGDPDIPTVRVHVTIDEIASGETRMTIEMTFPSREAMDQLLSIGFEEGMSTAVRQLDDVLRTGVGPTEVLQLRLVVEAEDYDDAVAFYRDVLGLPEQLAFEGDGDARVVILDAGRATLEIANPAQKRMIDEVEVGHHTSARLRVAFEVTDAQGTTERLVAAGATLVAPPTETPWRSRNARLDAPAGLHLTLFEELETIDERRARTGFGTAADRRSEG